MPVTSISALNLHVAPRAPRTVPSCKRFVSLDDAGLLPQTSLFPAQALLSYSRNLNASREFRPNRLPWVAENEYDMPAHPFLLHFGFHKYVDALLGERGKFVRLFENHSEFEQALRTQESVSGLLLFMQRTQGHCCAVVVNRAKGMVSYFDPDEPRPVDLKLIVLTCQRNGYGVEILGSGPQNTLAGLGLDVGFCTIWCFIFTALTCLHDTCEPAHIAKYLTDMPPFKQLDMALRMLSALTLVYRRIYGTRQKWMDSFGLKSTPNYHYYVNGSDGD
jgi:hypothetical protein